MRSLSVILPRSPQLLWSVCPPPLPLSHTHATQPQQKALHRGYRFPVERSPWDQVVCKAVPELALGTAFWGQSTFEPKATLTWMQTPWGGGLVSMTVRPCLPLESGRPGGCTPWMPWWPWWLPGPGGLQKGDLALVKARRRARLWPVDLNDVLDGPPADGAAGPGLPLEPQAAAVAQAHVSTRVDDRVHLAVEAHRALAVLAAGQLRWGEHGGHRGAQRGAGGRHCAKGQQADLETQLSGRLCQGRGGVPEKAGLPGQNPWGDKFGRH